MIHRRTLLAFSLAASTLLVGCGTLGRLFSNDEFVVPAVMPPDFFFGMQVREAMEPPIDYLVKIERSGRVNYDVTIRAPKRTAFSGEHEFSEDEIFAVFQAVQDADFAAYDDNYKAADGAAPNRALGKRVLYVFADGLDKRVDADFVSVPGLDALQTKLVALLPPKVFDVSMGPEIDRSNPQEFIADAATNLVHLPGCGHVEKIAPGRRKAFRTAYQAIDFGFDACLECKPLETR